MLKVNLITILGGMLVLTGLVSPWFTFSIVDHSIRTCWKFKMSPFTLTIKVYNVNDPFNEIISSGCHRFYRADTALIGVVCVLGAIFSFLGGGMDRWRLSLVGGVMTLLSTLSFWMCLPSYLSGLTVGWGISVSTFGAIVIISSIGLGFLMDKISSIIRLALRE